MGISPDIKPDYVFPDGIQTVRGEIARMALLPVIDPISKFLEECARMRVGLLGIGFGLQTPAPLVINSYLLDVRTGEVKQIPVKIPTPPIATQTLFLALPEGIVGWDNLGNAVADLTSAISAAAFSQKTTPPSILPISIDTQKPAHMKSFSEFRSDSDNRPFDVNGGQIVTFHYKAIVGFPQR